MVQSRLFRPIRVGRHELPNRLVMPSMGTNFADAEGRVTQRMIDYYAARAAGRPGLIVAEAACVHPSGKVVHFHLMDADSTAVDGLSRLASAIGAHGVRAVLQLIHGGRNATSNVGGDLIAPSAVRGPTARSTPRAMTVLEIEAMVGCFVRAAERAVAAGFDGVEIHGAHEYLIHQFLTPYCNRREDDYGGSLERRARFALEVVRAVREAIGPEAILAFRLSGDDHVRGGLSSEQAAEIAVLLEAAGVDLFNVTGGVYETPQMVVPPLPSPPGTHVEAAARVKAAVTVPVAGVGRITTAAHAEDALDRVDMVCLGRALLADPQWLLKVGEDREGEIRPCIGCNQGCIDHVLEGIPIACVANPWMGHEGALRTAGRAADGGRVVVIGGGPAGLECTCTLADLGHGVVLFEAEDRLGGQLPLAAVPPGKEEFAGLVRYYERRLRALPGVDVRLGTPATVPEVRGCAPGAVVVASGSAPVLPQLPGAGDAPLITARALLSGQAEAGRRVAVLGGGCLGSEVAHHLASRGHEVCIIELDRDIGMDLGPARRHFLRRELREYRVRRYVRAMVRRLYPDRVTLVHTTNGGSRQLDDVGPVDTFVTAMGARPVDELFLALEGEIPLLYLVGDALSPARLGEATAEGARAAVAVHEALLGVPPGRTA